MKKFIVYANLLLAAITGQTDAHGMMTSPRSRNVIHNSDWCPQCLNAGGPFVMYDGNSKRYGVCGDPWNGERKHEVGGVFSWKQGDPVQATVAQGGSLAVSVVLTANHKGRFRVEACALPNPGGVEQERAALVETCFVPLRRLDDDEIHTYVPSNVNSFDITYRIPRDFPPSDRAVVRWWYQSGNSCQVADTPTAYSTPGLSICGSDSAPKPEEFMNCADVRIVAKGGGTPKKKRRRKHRKQRD